MLLDIGCIDDHELAEGKTLRRYVMKQLKGLGGHRLIVFIVRD